MKKLVIYMMGLGALLTSCGANSSKKTVDAAATDSATSALVAGGDVDEHGCKTSAGYRWSEALQDCIRMWEVGVQMTSTTDLQSTQAGYVVFSKDSTQVELFLPEKEVNALLQRMHPVSNPNEWVWSSDTASNGLKVYQNKKKQWVIEQEGKAIYLQAEKK